MSFEFINLPEITNDKRLVQRGRRDDGESLEIFLNGVSTPVRLPNPKEFQVTLNLLVGKNTVTLKTQSGEVLTEEVILNPIEVEHEFVDTFLDNYGFLTNVRRQRGERSYIYHKWIRVANDTYLRDGSPRGMYHAGLIASRTSKRDIMFIESDSEFSMMVATTHVDVRSEEFVETKVLPKGKHKYLDTKVISDVLFPNNLEFNKKGELVVEEDTEVTFRYFLRVPKNTEIFNLAAMIGQCNNSSVKGETPSCLKGVGDVDDLPTRHIAGKFGCGNGRCLRFEKKTLKVDFSFRRRKESSLGITPGFYNAIWDGKSYKVALKWSPLQVVFLSEEKGVDIISQDKIAGEPGNPINEIFEKTSGTLPYLYGKVREDSFIFADSIGRDQEGGIEPRLDVNPGTNNLYAGGRVKSELVSTGKNVGLRLEESTIFLGDERYRLMPDKEVKNLVEFAILKLNVGSLPTRFSGSENISNTSFDLLNDGVTRNPLSFFLISASLDDLSISTKLVDILWPYLSISLRKISLFSPKVKDFLTDNSMLFLKFEKSDFSTSVDIEYRVGDGELIIENLPEGSIVSSKNRNLNTNGIGYYQT